MAEDNHFELLTRHVPRWARLWEEGAFTDREAVNRILGECVITLASDLSEGETIARTLAAVPKPLLDLLVEELRTHPPIPDARIEAAISLLRERFGV